MEKPIIPNSARNLVAVGDLIISQIAESMPQTQKMLVYPLLSQFWNQYQGTINDEKASSLIYEIESILQIIKGGAGE